VSRQIQTGKKFYPTDWSLNLYGNSEDVGSTFETMIINSIARHLSFQNFSRLTPLTLSYFQNYQKEELDLVVQDRKKIHIAFEMKVKAKGDDLAKAARIIEQLRAPFGVVVTGAPGVIEYYREKILHVSAEILLAGLF
jgi:predicted AAA+ superfamily ATPase